MMYVKGHVISQLPQFLRAEFGDDGLAVWKTFLSRQALDIYGNKIEKDEWYPLKLSLIQPVNAACVVFYHDGLRGATEFGRFLAGQDKRKELRLLPFKASREAQLKKACARLQSHFDTSQVLLEDVDDQGAIIRVCRFTEMDDVIEAVMAGWIQKHVGYDDRKVHSIEVIGSSNRGKCIEYALKWKTA